jgi:hypothetical protein
VKSLQGTSGYPLENACDKDEEEGAQREKAEARRELARLQSQKERRKVGEQLRDGVKGMLGESGSDSSSGSGDTSLKDALSESMIDELTSELTQISDDPQVLVHGTSAWWTAQHAEVRRQQLRRNVDELHNVAGNGTLNCICEGELKISDMII